MELKHIKELMAAMGRTGTKRINLKKEGFEILIEREEQIQGKMIEPSYDSTIDVHPYSEAWLRADQALSRSSESLKHTLSQPVQMEKGDSSGSFVTSPMVGTFYNSSSPEALPFIKVGDRVEKNDVVCIIEAMKVMNEIKAGIAGTIAEILVDTSHPVEFGTKLFRIVE